MFRTAAVGLLAAQLFSCNHIIAETPMSVELRAQIESAKKRAARSGDGHVIVGQVVVEDGDDPALVKSQMLILNDGFFAGATRDPLRPVGFRMHGYAPFDLDLANLDVKANDQKIIDVGVIKLKRLEPKELVKFKGLLTLEDSGDPNTASISMSVANGPVNTPSMGQNHGVGGPKQSRYAPTKTACSNSGVFPRSNTTVRLQPLATFPTVSRSTLATRSLLFWEESNWKSHGASPCNSFAPVRTRKSLTLKKRSGS